MMANIDLPAFYDNIRATKPPYECPVADCRKIYRSFIGIEQHVKRHENTERTGGQSVIISSCDDDEDAPTVDTAADKLKRSIGNI